MLCCRLENSGRAKEQGLYLPHETRRRFLEESMTKFRLHCPGCLADFKLSVETVGDHRIVACAECGRVITAYPAPDPEMERMVKSLGARLKMGGK